MIVEGIVLEIKITPRNIIKKPIDFIVYYHHIGNILKNCCLPPMTKSSQHNILGTRAIVVPSNKIIRAKDIMNTDAILVSTQTSVKDAAKKMMALNKNYIVTVENNIPVGIVTYKDLVRKNIIIASLTDTSIKEIMSTPLIHSGPDQSIWEVMDLMHARDIKVIPIIDEYDKLLGTIHLMDIIKVLSLSIN